ncbi:MAG: hypothetical protein H6742_20840, partial [Alphaproteobacteria bacterium]|nr:hypothetical protein [Alphaproteobacteria bacterium]
MRPLMAGKEAAAWIVESEGELRCAKVYKQAHMRSFQNRADYTEGRKTRNSRDERARAKKTRYGRSQEESAWQTTEVDALYKLATAGVRVPKPHLFMDGVLLMELVTDHLGNPAPRLIDVGLNSTQARAMMQFMAQQSVCMLLAGVVHGDLSEYNVLIAADGPIIIDFPQALDAAANRNAQRVFERDLDHIAQFLSRFAPDLARTRYGREIWRLYEQGKLAPDTELSGKVDERHARPVDGARLRREIELVDAADREEGGGGERKRRRKRKRRGGGGPSVEAFGGGGQAGGGQGASGGG